MFSQKIERLKSEHQDLSIKVADPKYMSDQRAYSKLSSRFNELEKILNLAGGVQELELQLKEAKELLESETDKEMLELAKDEIASLETNLDSKTDALKKMLIPKDPNDKRDCIVEIRAGTGGNESGLFVADLYRMYTYFAEQNKWKKQIISSNPSEKGGFKEIIFSLSGENAYGTMRFESGVHRVQRVPLTEANGRIHTSAVTVAVLPEADEVDVQIDPKDLKIDVYRSSGNGGQSVNTTDSAVRITHLPTGTVVTCQDEKSQLKNKNKAMKVLLSRLLDTEIAAQEAQIAKTRKTQIGTGDRSGKIRTYNFPQGRVTDHRINLTLYKLDNIMSGDIEEITKSLQVAFYEEKGKE